MDRESDSGLSFSRVLDSGSLLLYLATSIIDLALVGVMIGEIG